jgi:hypothetical protein
VRDVLRVRPSKVNYCPIAVHSTMSSSDITALSPFTYCVVFRLNMPCVLEITLVIQAKKKF